MWKSSVWGKLCFIPNIYFQFYHWKNNFVLFSLYMTKIDLFSLSIFMLFVLLCIPGTCVFYNSWKEIHMWSDNQFSCSILRKIFAMRVGDYEQIINYDWPYRILFLWKNEIQSNLQIYSISPSWLEFFLLFSKLQKEFLFLRNIEN